MIVIQAEKDQVFVIHRAHIRFALLSLKHARERQSASKYLRHLFAVYENFESHKSRVMEQM